MAPRSIEKKLQIATVGMDPVQSSVYRAIDSVIRKQKRLGTRKQQLQRHGDKYKVQRKTRDSEYYQETKELQRPRRKAYREKNRDRINKQSQSINKERRKIDEDYLVSCRSRSRLGNYLRKKGAKKTGKTMKLIGKCPEALREYLEMFTKLRVRDNEIDHIFPLAAYGTDEDSQKKSNHFSNLQLLTKEENQSKLARLPTKQMADKVEQWAWPDGIRYDDLPNIYDNWTSPLKM